MSALDDLYQTVDKLKEALENPSDELLDLQDVLRVILNRHYFKACENCEGKYEIQIERAVVGGYEEDSEYCKECDNGIVTEDRHV